MAIIMRMINALKVSDKNSECSLFGWVEARSLKLIRRK